MTRTKVRNSSLSFDGGPLSGFRNAIINGNFDFWQRGTSFSGQEYGADRWYNNRNGSSSTMSRQAFTVGQTDVPGEPTYFCRQVVTSVAGAANYVQLFQLIEDVRTFAGQQLTLSFWAKADASKSIAIELSQKFGTGGSPSGDVGFGITKTTIGTSWQKVTVTATAPSISDKTIGSNSNSSLGVTIWLDAGSDYNSRTSSLGQQSGTFDIAQVQVERGPISTPFERRPIGAELELCRRYYQIQNVSTNSYGAQYSGNTVFMGDIVPFTTPMRSTAPIATYNYVSGTSYWVTVGSVAFSANSSTGLTVNVGDGWWKLSQTRQAGNSTPTAANYYIWEPAFYITLSAEL